MNSKEGTNIAFVVQRYGKEVLGGAESLARQLAEQFHSELGWEIEILTTTSKDYMTWMNEYDEGEDFLHGIRIRRFHSNSGRSKLFPLVHRVFQKCLPIIAKARFMKPLLCFLENLWFLAQGPVCPNLVDYIKKHKDKYQQIFFFTYLYYPTVWGTKAAFPKGVLIPTAHDEFAFHFENVKRMLNAIPGIIALNPEEKRLIESKLHGNYDKVKLASVGITAPSTTEPTSTMQKVAAQKALYLGRISAGKSADQLINWMHRHFSDTTLLLAGKLEEITLPKSNFIDYRGFVSEEEKTELFKEATVLINPSNNESLSLIVLEAMLHKIPILVNGNCEVLRYYAVNTKSVRAFYDETSFITELENILATDWTKPENKAILQDSSDWVMLNYSWASVYKVYESFIKKQDR